MKRSQSLLSFILIIVLIYFSFSSLMPKSGAPSTISETEFSSERALIPLKEITKKPHYIGTEEHERVREYIIKQLNLTVSGGARLMPWLPSFFSISSYIFITALAFFERKLYL